MVASATSWNISFLDIINFQLYFFQLWMKILWLMKSQQHHLISTFIAFNFSLKFSSTSSISNKHALSVTSICNLLDFLPDSNSSSHLVMRIYCACFLTFVISKVIFYHSGVVFLRFQCFICRNANSWFYVIARFTAKFWSV